MASLFEAHGFKTVIDASGWCALKSSIDLALARRLNVDIGRSAMQQAEAVGPARSAFPPTRVFDGDPPRAASGERRLVRGYPEDYQVSPVTVYGKMMAEAERLITEGYPEAAILRIALPMGPSLNGHAGAIDWIESRFRKGRPATLYFDEVRSNLYVQDLGRVLDHFRGNQAKGLWHVGGPRPLSLYQIAQVINRLGNYPPELLMGCRRAAAGPCLPAPETWG